MRACHPTSKFTINLHALRHWTISIIYQSAEHFILQTVTQTSLVNTGMIRQKSLLLEVRKGAVSMWVRDFGDSLCWWQLWDAGNRVLTLNKSPTSWWPIWDVGDQFFTIKKWSTQWKKSLSS